MDENQPDLQYKLAQLEHEFEVSADARLSDWQRLTVVLGGRDHRKRVCSTGFARRLVQVIDLDSCLQIQQAADTALLPVPWLLAGGS